MNRLVWFRNDLRLHDNEAVASALNDARGTVSFVYVYDEKWDLPTPEGYPRLGLFRKKFLAESLIELRQNLRSLGADLICAFGDPVKTISKICEQLEIGECFYSRLSACDEQQQEIAVERELESKGIKCRSFQTHTLVCKDDFEDTDLSGSMSFSKFRNVIEKSWKIRKPILPITTVGKVLNSRHALKIPLWDLESSVGEAASKRGFHAKGGATEGRARVEEYFWSADRLRTYKETRNGLLARNDSSKFSPFLALGCLSPRFLYSEVRRYERERIKNSSTLWFLYELLWRDYFHFAALRRGKGLFTDDAKQVPANTASEQQQEIFKAWCLGQTGNSFIDAAMTELRQTGWMSNRMRQNAASFFIFDMSGDWRAGARWFETCLVDYDPGSNWGNWSYIAGAGRENQPHIFNVEQQARAYDADGEYQKFWTAR